MENLPNEVFYLVLLNQSNVIMATEKISEGGISATVVDIRILLKKPLNIVLLPFLLHTIIPAAISNPVSLTFALPNKSSRPQISWKLGWLITLLSLRGVLQFHGRGCRLISVKPLAKSHYKPVEMC